MKKILVIGSINVDNVTYTHQPAKGGMTVYGDSFLSNIGGKGANQSCAIKFLGGDVVFHGVVGDDENGKLVQKYLKEQGLTTNLKVSQSCTGVANIVVDMNTGENSIIVVPGANYDFNTEDIDNINFAEKDILLLQLENNINVVEYAIKRAKEHGLLVVLNPAPFHKLNKNVYQHIDFFIPNEHELEQFTDDLKDASYLERAKHLISQGINKIIVTLGEKGSLYVDKDKHFYLKLILIEHHRLHHLKRYFYFVHEH